MPFDKAVCSTAGQLVVHHSPFGSHMDLTSICLTGGGGYVVSAGQYKISEVPDLPYIFLSTKLECMVYTFIFICFFLPRSLKIWGIPKFKRKMAVRFIYCNFKDC